MSFAFDYSSTNYSTMCQLNHMEVLWISFSHGSRDFKNGFLVLEFSSVLGWKPKNGCSLHFINKEILAYSNNLTTNPVLYVTHKHTHSLIRAKCQLWDNLFHCIPNPLKFQEVSKFQKEFQKLL